MLKRFGMDRGAPDEWEIATLLVVYKSALSHKPQNHRPVDLSGFLRKSGKQLEKT